MGKPGRELTPGQRLKKWRKGLTWSQTKAAEYLGVSQPTYSEWENDRSTPGIATLPKVALETGIPFDAFVSGKLTRQAAKRSRKAA